MSMELSEVEKEHLKQREAIKGLELECDELKARIKLRELKAELGEPMNLSIDEMIDCLDKGVIELLNRRNARIDKLESALTEIRQEHTAMQNTLAEVDRDRTEWIQKTFDAQRMIDSVNSDEIDTSETHALE